MREQRQRTFEPATDAVLGPPLGALLNRLLGRGGESDGRDLAGPSAPRITGVVDADLPERLLADPEAGRIVYELLSGASRSNPWSELRLRVRRRRNLGEIEKLLRPQCCWLQVELSGEGAEERAEGIAGFLAEHGYRTVERVRQGRATLAILWRPGEDALPVLVELRRATAATRVSLLFPQLRF